MNDDGMTQEPQAFVAFFLRKLFNVVVMFSSTYANTARQFFLAQEPYYVREL